MSVSSIVKAIQNQMRKDPGVDGDAQRIGQLCWMFFLKVIGDQDKDLLLEDPFYVSPVPPAFQWDAWASSGSRGPIGDALVAFVNDQLFPTLSDLEGSNPRTVVVRELFRDANNYMKSGRAMREVLDRIDQINFNSLKDRQHFGDIYEQILASLQSAGNAGEFYTPRALTSFIVKMTDPKPGEIVIDPACGTGGFITCAIRHMQEHYVRTPPDRALMESGLRAIEKKPLPHMLCLTNMLIHGIENPAFVRHDNTLARPYSDVDPEGEVDIVLSNPPFGGKEEDGIEMNFPMKFRCRETADLFMALIVQMLKPGGRAAVVLPDGFMFGDGVKSRVKQQILETCNLHTVLRLPGSVFAPYTPIGTNVLFFEKGAPTSETWFFEHRIRPGLKAYSKTRPMQVSDLDDCAAWWGGADRAGRVETEQAWRVPAEDLFAGGLNLDIKNPHVAEVQKSDPFQLQAEILASKARINELHAELRAILLGALAR